MTQPQQPKKYDVLAFGALVVDIQIASTDDTLDAHNLRKGFTNLVDAKTANTILAAADQPKRSPGGPGTNVAAGIALRGGKAALAGKIAADDNGAFLTQRLQSHGIEFVPLLSDNPATGTTAVLALTTPDKERSFAFAAGASMEMRVEDIDQSLIRDAKIVYIDSYLWLTEDGRDAVRHAAAATKQAGGMLAVSLNDAKLVASHQAEFLALVKSHADIVVGDKREFMALFGTDTVEDTIDAVLGAKVTAAMTLGKQGAYVFKYGAYTQIPAKTIDQSLVVDTNGAGDQFAAGFIYGIAEGKDLVASAEQGASWASDVIRHFGAEPQVGRNAPAVNQNTPKPPKIAA